MWGTRISPVSVYVCLLANATIAKLAHKIMQATICMAPWWPIKKVSVVEAMAVKAQLRNFRHLLLYFSLGIQDFLWAWVVASDKLEGFLPCCPHSTLDDIFSATITISSHVGRQRKLSSVNLFQCLFPSSHLFPVRKRNYFTPLQNTTRRTSCNSCIVQPRQQQWKRSYFTIIPVSYILKTVLQGLPTGH